MGFRELSRFNDSLLAKQVWRLKNNEDSLFHRVFKTKFFPNCSIMEANSSSKGSYARMSIAQARRVIDLGSVWRVGDGKSIKSGVINGYQACTVVVLCPLSRPFALSQL